MSLSAPPSTCPNCRVRIKAYDNIPVVSWLVLRARCRACGNPISARYPLVEAGTALFFAVVAVGGAVAYSRISGTQDAIAGGLVLIAFLYLAAISTALALIDLDTHRLPNRIVVPAYIVSLVLFVAAAMLGGHFDGLFRGGVGMVAMALAYFLMAFAYPGGMGLGDVKLAGVLGIYLGWVGWGALIVGTLAAFVLGGLYAVILMLLKRANRKSGIPFGPWMLAGAWLGIGVGNLVFVAYLSLFDLAVV
jgi:leader peptidase (prepilin peptidase)/N-methyltransferase